MCREPSDSLHLLSIPNHRSKFSHFTFIICSSSSSSSAVYCLIECWILTFFEHRIGYKCCFGLCGSIEMPNRHSNSFFSRPIYFFTKTINSKINRKKSGPHSVKILYIFFFLAFKIITIICYLFFASFSHAVSVEVESCRVVLFTFCVKNAHNLGKNGNWTGLCTLQRENCILPFQTVMLNASAAQVPRRTRRMPKIY